MLDPDDQQLQDIARGTRGAFGKESKGMEMRLRREAQFIQKIKKYLVPGAKDPDFEGKYSKVQLKACKKRLEARQ